MTIDELKNLRVEIRCYVTCDNDEPELCTSCQLSEALERMKIIVEDSPEEFYDLAFKIYTEDGTYLFAIRRALEDVYLGFENKYNLTTDMIRDALGMGERRKKSLEELIRTLNDKTEVLILGFPDPYEVGYNDYVHHCALKDSLHRMSRHLDELNLNEYERLGYDFSVLLIGDGGHKLIYSYNGNREIRVRKEFKDILKTLSIF